MAHERLYSELVSTKDNVITDQIDSKMREVFGLSYCKTPYGP